MKTTNTYKTKPNETRAWFRSPFMTSDQDTDHAYFTATWKEQNRREN